MNGDDILLQSIEPSRERVGRGFSASFAVYAGGRLEGLLHLGIDGTWRLHTGPYDRRCDLELGRNLGPAVLRDALAEARGQGLHVYLTGPGRSVLSWGPPGGEAA